jgi:hypothetical protein
MAPSVPNKPESGSHQDFLEKNQEITGKSRGNTRFCDGSG